jgi:hypothetical protein
VSTSSNGFNAAEQHNLLLLLLLRKTYSLQDIKTMRQLQDHQMSCMSGSKSHFGFPLSTKIAKRTAANDLMAPPRSGTVPFLQL